MGETRRFLTVTMVRFWSGTAGGVLAGTAVFGTGVFRPYHPAFECVTIGALAAGTLTLVRQSHAGEAFALALAFGVMGSFVSPTLKLGSLIHGLALGLGLFLVAVIYDLLARGGWRFGKFLLAGPLVGGIYLALAPLSELADMNVFNASRLMLFRLVLGTVIGEGVCVGVELAELVPSVREGRAAEPEEGLTGAPVASSDGEGA